MNVHRHVLITVNVVTKSGTRYFWPTVITIKPNFQFNSDHGMDILPLFCLRDLYGCTKSNFSLGKPHAWQWERAYNIVEFPCSHV